jgi:uncharacterized protein (TIGR00255 family)
MTGFGQASWQKGGWRLAVEVRSVNQRFLDVRLNLPREYQPFEEALRQMVQAEAQRGKVDVTVHRAGSGATDVEVEINEPLARATVEGWRRLQRRLGLQGEIDVSFLVGRGDFVRVVERKRETHPELPQLKRLLGAALKAFNRAREREGRALQKDMIARVQRLKRIAEAVRRRSSTFVPEVSTRLAERLAALLSGQTIEPERLAQEAALLASRAEVTEELVRLDSHLDRLAELLRQKGPIGKPIDFLLQEIHREINTVASKSADLEITNHTLEARAEVEKLREQGQNVE